ncbi:MAG TPA: sensor histidine kinase, partial [Baekduia sp.]|nr:sensor histidine kinase [Baekduia sp.]
TEKKRFEFELREAHDGLERAVRDRTHALQSALDQKTVLLHEVDHRVKNNLQLISSIVQLQLRRSPDEAVRQALGAVMERVGAISTVHRRLFQSDDVGRFDVADFIIDLTDDLGPVAAEKGLRIDLSLEPVAVSSGKAAPVALIVSELMQNALKHAFPGGREGRIHVTVDRRGEDYRIMVEDDGVGSDWSHRGGGRYIVELLARQLRATVDWGRSERGARVAVTLPVSGMVPV